MNCPFYILEAVAGIVYAAYMLWCAIAVFNHPSRRRSFRGEPKSDWRLIGGYLAGALLCVVFIGFTLIGVRGWAEAELAAHPAPAATAGAREGGQTPRERAYA